MNASPNDIASTSQHLAAPADLVNRTHRIVRERAVAVNARRRHTRALWIPLAISAALILAVVFAVWSVLAESDLAYAGLPNAAQQIVVFTMWCVPISLAALAVVLFRRSSSLMDNGERP